MSTSRFLYHAFAVGLAGEIKRPFEHVIDGQASCALTRYGGHATDTAPKYKLAHVVAHGGAAAEVTGVYQKSSDTHETTALATLNGLDLEGVVKTGAIASTVHSSHPASTHDEPVIKIAGSRLEGLSVDGHAVELESWLHLLNQLDTMTKLRDHYKNDGEFRRAFDAAAYVGRADELPADVQRFFPWRHFKPTGQIPEYNGMTIVPVLTAKATSSPRCKIYGNVVKIENFGKVQVGELIVESHHRRLMMFHASMGSPCEGDITSGCSGGNGSSGNPPPPDGGDN